MARIRSIHPGFFTDEDLVCVSMAARLLVIGLGVEADDKGIFEWKPLTIKMRIFPADNVIVEELLAELSNVGIVREYEIDGRKYGAIRNFRRHQRPKKPNDIHPIAPEIGTFIGLDNEGSEPVPNQFPTGGENPPQMEDGGWSSSSVSNETAPIEPVDPEKVMFDSGVALLVSCGKSEGVARRWLGKVKRDYGAEAVITMIGRAKREGTPDPIAFMEGGLRSGARARASPELLAPC